jgi:hypothetical protein
MKIRYGSTKRLELAAVFFFSRKQKSGSSGGIFASNSNFRKTLKNTSWFCGA